MGVEATVGVVDLLMSFREVALWIFVLLLLISLFGLLEHTIHETLESVAVLGLVLSLWMKNANLIQEAFEFIQPGLVLLITSWLLHVVDREICLPLLAQPFDELG
jgi:hypothetical protein